MSSPDLLELVLTRDRPSLRRALRELKTRPQKIADLPQALRERVEKSIATRAVRSQRKQMAPR